MATKTIVTSQPDVACDVCQRRLLRGEQPDLFLAGGQRRVVCELCAPRATHEGWLRESDRHSVGLPRTRPRRGRSLLERFRQLREPGSGFAQEDSGAARDVESRTLRGYDFLESPREDEMNEPLRWLGEELDADGAAGPAQVAVDSDSRRPWPASPASGGDEVVTSGEVKVERALGVFNVGEHPRRIAGVARSLGAPSVSIRPVADSGSVVGIVVCWELCWYRYEVDLADESSGAQVVAQGTELAELTEEDRLANAVADEHGTLLLASIRAR